MTEQQQKPALAVGQTWRRRDGDIVNIEGISTDHPWGQTHPFASDQGDTYTPDGYYNPVGEGESGYDLVELIYDSPQPAPIPRLFRSIVKCDDWEYAVATDGTAWRRLFFLDAGDWLHGDWKQITPPPSAGEGEE